MFNLLNPNVDVVLATTVSRDVREVHQISIPFVAIFLQRYPGFLHISFDGWTAPNIDSFLGVVVHLLQDEKMLSYTLDFIEYVLFICWTVFN